MAYTSKDQLQLYCIFMLAFAGIQAVFFSVKMSGTPEHVAQMALIVCLFLVACVGYSATEARSLTRAKWFFQGLIVLAVAEVVELGVSVVLHYAGDDADNQRYFKSVLMSEVFNLVCAPLGIWLGYRYYNFLSSGAVLTCGAYLSPEMTQIQGDDVDHGPPDAKQTLLAQL